MESNLVSVPWEFSLLMLLPTFSRTEVQCHLDREGASNLVAELIMKNPSHKIFVETVELGIALLEGGNSVIQQSVLNKLISGNSSDKFFKVILAPASRRNDR